MTPSHNSDKERILCAAIWFQDGVRYTHSPKNITTGFVVCGRRHHNVYEIVHRLTPSDKRKAKLKSLHQIEGFITSHDRFVDREEAMRIAIIANQIIPRVGANLNKLFSEDLY